MASSPSLKSKDSTLNMIDFFFTFSNFQADWSAWLSQVCLLSSTSGPARIYSVHWFSAPKNSLRAKQQSRPLKISWTTESRRARHKADWAKVLIFHQCSLPTLQPFWSVSQRWCKFIKLLDRPKVAGQLRLQLTVSQALCWVVQCCKKKIPKIKNVDFLELNFDSSASNLKPDSLTENSKGKITRYLNPWYHTLRLREISLREIRICEISKISMFGFWNTIP